MKTGKIEELRREYHRRVGTEVLRKNENGTPSNADSASAASVEIGKRIVAHIGLDVETGKLPGQTAGSQFELATRDFLQSAFTLLHRKGKTPHIVVVIGEPLPGRIASLAYGIGDIDCVYHFALRELKKATEEGVPGSDSLETLNTLISGKRLRDISDLPFDLAT